MLRRQMRVRGLALRQEFEVSLFEDVCLPRGCSFVRTEQAPIGSLIHTRRASVVPGKAVPYFGSPARLTRMCLLGSKQRCGMYETVLRLCKRVGI